jgi:hypothetical protein
MITKRKCVCSARSVPHTLFIDGHTVNIWECTKCFSKKEEAK